MTLSNQARKAKRAPIDQWHTPATIKYPKDRIFCRHTQIAPESHFQSPGDSITLNGSNDGFGEQHPCNAQGAISFFADMRHACSLSDRFEIEARTKGSSTSVQDRDR